MVEETTQNKKREIPAAYQKLTVIDQLGLGTWETILNAAAEGENIPQGGLTKDSLHRFIRDTKQVNERLTIALKVIFELGNYAGRNLFQQAADDISTSLDTSDNESDRELAARVWLLSQSQHQYLRILSRALADYEYSKKFNSVREYAGESNFNIDGLDEDTIKNKVTEWCLENNRNGVAELDIAERAGVHWCYIYRGEPLKRVSVITDENKRDQLTFRPEACDLVRIDPETGRIGIITRSDKLRDVYRSVLGEALIGDPNYFSRENICTLAPLQMKGEELFEDKPPTFRSIKVIDLKWRRGGQDTIIVKGRDCLKILNDLKVKFHDGEIIEARFSFESYGSGRPTRVTIKVPTIIDIPPNEYEAVINRFLTNIGIRGRFDTNCERKDFWSLSPWTYSQSEWRCQISDDFEILKKAGCFKEICLTSAKHPNHLSSSGNMLVEQTETGEVVGISDDSDIGVRTLTATDLEGYKLDVERLARFISDSLSLSSEYKEISTEIISLGWRILSPSTKVKVFLATSPPSANASILMNHHAPGARPVLIIPEGCNYNGAIPYISANLTNLYFDNLFGDLVKALGIQGEVPAREWNSHDLIIDLKHNRIWYKEIELDRVNFNEHDYKLALEIVRKKGEVVQTVSLNELLSPDPDDYNEKLAHRAKSKFMKKINSALEERGYAKCNPKDIFETKGGGYALNCSACLIEQESL